VVRRVLVVDDERLSRLVTEGMLEKLGFRVETVNDGRAAVDAEAEASFVAIIMDCQMPSMDGFQATAAIRRREAESKGARTPIIGLSARDMEGDSEIAISKGMDAYVTKPVTFRSLQAAMAQVGIETHAGDRPALQ